MMHKFDKKTFTMKKQNLSIAYYFIGRRIINRIVGMHKIQYGLIPFNPENTL